MISSLRSPIIDNSFSDKAYPLIQYPSVDSEKLFLALTATRWRYVFLELFRCIEAVLYMTWVMDLKKSVNGIFTLRKGYESIRTSLGWREDKGVSIQKLFSLFELDSDISMAESNVDQFQELLGTEGFKRAWIGKKIYKIRNQLVHHEDFTDRTVLNVTEDEFRDISVYLVIFLQKLFALYDKDLRA